MINILVTGAKGQLGSEIRKASADQADMSFLFTDIEELDISNRTAVSGFLDENPVNFLVNCAAYTAVDKAEDDRETAERINSHAVDILAGEARARDIRFIHTSTDYVFNGEKNRPYREEDPVNPVTAYGKTKLAGEEAVHRNGSGIIVRTSWLYSSFGHNFVKTILRLCREKGQLRVVFDQTGSPTYARDLAEAILAIVRKEDQAGKKPEVEVFHYSNTGICSWFEFATEIVKGSGLECPVEPVVSEEFPTRAARPRYSAMDSKKIRDRYGIRIPHWKDSLRDCLKELTEN
jgi:dTDP-4-dehydrorhamnose reductase